MHVHYRLGHRLARYLSTPIHSGGLSATSPPELLLATLRKGDMLPVEGNTRLLVAIKFLTQSS